MATAPAKAPLRMSFEEYLNHDWADEQMFTEWEDGEVIVLTTTAEHQIIAKFLTLALDQYVQMRDLGLILFAPFAMKLGPTASGRLSGREPDVLFVAKENLPRLRENYLDGPADLVVEIISPDSRVRDRQRKFREYEQAGIGEYWIVDPQTRMAEFYQRGEDGAYRGVPPGDDGRYHSAVLKGLWLEVNWLWQRPLPPLVDVLKAWELL